MITLSFAELAALVSGWYTDERLSHRDIAARLIAQDVAPALGHGQWSWRTVNEVLVHAAAQRRALEKDATS
jgi:hypothetical protein